MIYGNYMQHISAIEKLAFSSIGNGGQLQTLGTKNRAKNAYLAQFIITQRKQMTSSAICAKYSCAHCHVWQLATLILVCTLPRLPSLIVAAAGGIVASFPGLSYYERSPLQAVIRDGPPGPSTVAIVGPPLP